MTGARPPIVLVHGAWHGAWAWARLVPLLAAGGYPVTAVNLTGLGENRHMVSPGIGLATHVEDLTAHLFMHDLRGVVVVGHSYGGCVLSGALAADAEGRIAHAIYLDAVVPDDGESLATHALPEMRDGFEAAEAAGAYVPPRPEAALGAMWGLTGTLAAFAVPRLCPMPPRCFLQPVQGSPWRDGVRYDYLRCTQNPNPLFETQGRRAKADPRFRYAEVDGHHDVMLIDPPLMRDALLALIREEPAHGPA